MQRYRPESAVIVCDLAMLVQPGAGLPEQLPSRRRSRPRPEPSELLRRGSPPSARGGARAAHAADVSAAVAHRSGARCQGCAAVCPPRRCRTLLQGFSNCVPQNPWAPRSTFYTQHQFLVRRVTEAGVVPTLLQRCESTFICLASRLQACSCEGDAKPTPVLAQLAPMALELCKNYLSLEDVTQKKSMLRIGFL